MFMFIYFAETFILGSAVDLSGEQTSKLYFKR